MCLIEFACVSTCIHLAIIQDPYIHIHLSWGNILGSARSLQILLHFSHCFHSTSFFSHIPLPLCFFPVVLITPLTLLSNLSLVIFSNWSCFWKFTEVWTFFLISFQRGCICENANVRSHIQISLYPDAFLTWKFRTFFLLLWMCLVKCLNPIFQTFSGWKWCETGKHDSHFWWKV